ncbi:MAG: hypothetical protein R3D28_21305 [Geminicoccaceae bacterium]
MSATRLRQYLQKQGYRVTTADSAQAARRESPAPPSTSSSSTS